MTNNPLNYFDFDPEEINKINNQQKEHRQERDGRICVCGHAVTRHAGHDIGRGYCKPSKMDCPCKNLRPVLDSQDTRDFLMRTISTGPGHALTRGIATALNKGHWIRWIIEMQCDRCGAEKPISPVAVSQRGIGMDEATGYDKLLCKECREEI